METKAITVCVELFGIPRRRAGEAILRVQLSNSPATLSQLLLRLAEARPNLEGECIHEGALLPGYTVNINGQEFVRQGDTRLNDGDKVLILSADAGG